MSCPRSLGILTAAILALVPLTASAEYAGTNWSIGIYTGSTPFSLSSPSNVSNPVLTASDVTDEAASFLADPFLIQVGPVWYMFFEVGNAATGQGDVAYATSPDGFHWTYGQIVLDEPFHLSYPYVFQYQNEYYMIPESGQATSIRLYRASSFPTQWTLVGTLLSNAHYVDTSVAFYNNKWWLLTSPDTNDALRLFYSNNLTGPYTEHPRSPVVSADSNISRCGGRLLVDNGHVYRYTQDDNPTYGNQIRAFEITSLTTTTYAETARPENPIVTASHSGWNRDGMHTVDPHRLDGSTWIAAVDGQGDPTVINKTGWSLRYVDSQETVNENNAAVNAFDGITNTIWHTQFFSASPPPPHEIQIDLGRSYESYGFRYVPRQDNSTNGNIGNYEFYLSTDGTSWGSPVTTGTFPAGSDRKEVQFASQVGRYIRLRALSEIDGNPWTAVAELDLEALLFLGNHAPSGSVDAPATNLTVHAGDSASFAGSGSDPDGNLPLTYRWDFGAGSGVPPSTLQFPGSVTFNSPGTFTVGLTVKDSQGLSDPTPATRTITVLDAGSNPIPKGGWTLRYVDSQETTGENAAATNAFDGSNATFWHSQWFSASPPCPHEIQIDLGAIYDIDGFHYLPRQDGGFNGRIGQYEFYVSPDGVSWGTPAATGAFANDALEKIVRFAAVTGRFVRLRALTEANGGPFTSMAELTVLGLPHAGNQAPDGAITSPATGVAITVSDTLNFAGSASDPDANLPLSYHWTFGAGSGISDSSLEDPGLLQFNVAGTFTVTLVVTDALGLADPTPATRLIDVTTNVVQPETIGTISLAKTPGQPGHVDLSFGDVGAANYNVYVSNLPNTNPFAVAPESSGVKHCGVPTTSSQERVQPKGSGGGWLPEAGRQLVVEDFNPEAGISGSTQLLFLLVTADSGPGTEGSLGTDSTGISRTAVSYCNR